MEFNLSMEREKFKKDLWYALKKFDWGNSALDADAIRILNEWEKVLDAQDKEFIRLLDERGMKVPNPFDSSKEDIWMVSIKDLKELAGDKLK